MEECKNRKIFDSLSSPFDRLDEAAWFIRLMEENYHSADKFRWSLNSFLRALKEVMQLVTMAVQGNAQLSALVKETKTLLATDPLIDFLFKQRDIVVHRSMLKPASSGSIGFTRGRGLKLGLGMPIDPLSNSEDAIKKYIYFAAKDTDFMGILYTEEDGSGEYTCVQRQWRLSQFPEIELTQLAANAWEKVAEAFFDIARAMGAELIKPTFQLHDPNRVQFEIYNPEWVKEQLEHFKKVIAENET